MTTPWLLRGLVRVAQPLNGVVGRLPGFIGALGRLSSAAGIKALAKRPPSEPAVPSVLANPIRKVAILDGCAQSAIGQEINDSTRRLLGRLNVQVVPLNTKRPCCGALNLHLGYESKAVQQASVLVDGWSKLLACNEIDSIIVTTSGCGSVIRHYRELFKQDPIRQERAIRVENACVDITQFLTEFTLPISNRHLGARVAYHDSCSLRHGQKITSEPRTILESAGFKILNIAEGHLCCGSAGTYNILQPDIAHRLGQRKADNIKVTNADVIAAGNIGCLMQISLFLQTPIAHVVQLIDWATGGPAPRGMELFNPVEQVAGAPEALIWSDETAPLSENTDSLW
ncbi:MAG: heterodisulfide reductase-related iron-sulfur binding cluster [Advenella sp.]|uniref:heterodisulfide reductase-related iron-sulfur binding cluster n=1 Tax=Advenella sp. TaxID=1872388 RepID=UPI003F9B1602